LVTPKRLEKNRRQKFEALATYANLADTPEAWQRFRARYPDFFPETLSAWLYDFALQWHYEFATHEAGRHVLPPLLWYRNRLRAVWSRNDRLGYNLAVLLGFEEEAKRVSGEHPGEIASDPVVRPQAIPNQSPNPLRQQSEGLPPGRPVINGVSGEIGWQFGCELQQSVRELMQERWRAKICPQCGKFFAAQTTAQKLCSDACSEAAIRQRSLTWWNETGSERRAEAKSKARRK
jgi:ribosomal protein L37AE/L43A